MLSSNLCYHCSCFFVLLLLLRRSLTSAFINNMAVTAINTTITIISANINDLTNAIAAITGTVVAVLVISRPKNDCDSNRSTAFGN